MATPPSEPRSGYHRLDARQTVKDDILRPPVEYDRRKRGDNLFLWTVFLLLLVGLAMACWVGSYVIFNRPELPISYRILRKLKKIDLPQRFAVNAAPAGEFLTPSKLFDRYSAMSPAALRDLNHYLERNYLRNYPPGSQQVAYVTGRFTILDAYQLKPENFIPSGVVVLAVSTDQPKLLIEHIYSADASVAPVIKENLQTGMDVDFRRTYDLTAVLHVARLPSGHIQITAAPINYGSYAFTGASGGFSLAPPLELHVAAGLPIVRQAERDQAEKAYGAYRQKNGLSASFFRSRTAEATKPPATAIKGVDVPLPQPSAGPSPAAGALLATPANLATGKKGGKPAPAAPGLAQNKPAPVKEAPVKEVPVARAIAVETPAPAPAVVAVRRPPGAPGAALKPLPAPGSGAALQPFLGGGSSMPGAERSWPTYAAGKAPGGKNLRVNDIAAYAQRIGQSGEPPYYLNGQFVVRAVGENRLKGVKNAVMRPSSGSNVRLIVEYPPDRAAPTEGEEVNRDEQRPYQITSVRQVADGTLNVYAREISD